MNFDTAESLIGSSIETNVEAYRDYFRNVAQSGNPELVRRFMAGWSHNPKRQKSVLHWAVKEALDQRQRYLLRWAFDTYPQETWRLVQWQMGFEVRHGTQQWFDAFIREYAADRGTTIDRLAGPPVIGSVRTALIRTGSGIARGVVGALFLLGRLSM
nr:hypothetical protein HK105_002882 [Polyrhizophydium stewartii]